MTFKLRVAHLQSGAALTDDLGSQGRRQVGLSNVLLSSDDSKAHIELRNPLSSPESGDVEKQELIRWYLETYATEQPFETSKADLAAETIASYGRALAAQIADSGLLPRKGELEIEIFGRSDSGEDPENISNDSFSLQQLYWEVLEDVKLWPAGFKFSSVTLYRCAASTHGVSAEPLPAGRKDEERTKNTFNILLVVSRPGRAADIDYQLVSRCLVAMVDLVSEKNPVVKPTLTILRPPTWLAFREQLREHGPGYYDLVHFDMHGKIKKASARTAVLGFCKPDIFDPLAMQPDFRTAEEIGKVLSQAGVRNVVVNACNSANAQVGTTSSNLAETLLAHDLECILAMSFKVMDEAVEISMNALYQSLLLKNLPFTDAARISRIALMQNSQRRARYMHVVSLLDYIVPVLYRKVSPSGAFSSAELISPKQSAMAPSHLDSILKSIGKILPSARALRDETTSDEQDLLGRDTDILQLELLMSVSKLILLHGNGGCGKTALLRYVCRWWKASGWIQAYAYIDMKDEYCFSMDAFSESIGEQLNLGKGFQSEQGLVDKIKAGKYLIILDSLECLCTPIPTDQIGDQTLIQNLESFIKAVSNGRSMIILSSRQETTPLAPNLSGAHEMYHLEGLSILASADLLGQVAFDGGKFKREELRRRQNVDFLRRVVILLEGNPAAIRIVAPGLRNANGDAEALLNTLLYGAFEPDQKAHEQFRFVRSVYGLLGARSSIFKFEESLISPSLLGQFWTLMPMDLSPFFWFFYLRFSKYFQEGTFQSWDSDIFRRCVKSSSMSRGHAKFWPEISRALIDTGILQPAFIQREDFSKLPCYHVHPIFTIIMRASLKGESQKYTKYAYIRQFVLWGRVDDSKLLPEMRSAEWNGLTQHEDHMFNLQAVALRYSMDDGDLDEEIRQNDRSLFHWVHLHVNTRSILFDNHRQSQLFAPIYMEQLSRLWAMQSATIYLRSVPTSFVLDAILSYSQILNCILKDRSLAASVVDIALKTVSAWKSASPPGAVLGPHEEFVWFYLRHAEAKEILNLQLYKAKELFERNLADDPGDHPQIFYHAIRRLQLQNLQMWLNCVVQIGISEGALDLSDLTAEARKIASEFKGGSITSYLLSSLPENAGVIETLPLRKMNAWAMNREKTAVAKFGRLANRILDESMSANFDDLPRSHDSVEATNSFSAILISSPKDTPEWERQMAELEFGIRALGKDPTAASSLAPRIQREAESSTTSTGWQNIGEVHQQLFAAAVVHNENPDFKKGLTHLSEFLKTNQGLQASRLDLLITHVNMAACYNVLKQPVQTAKAVCKAVELISIAEAMKCKEDPDARPFVLFIYDKIAALDTLESFTKRRYMVSAPKEFKGLSFRERTTLLHTMQLARYASARLVREAEENVRSVTELNEEIKDLLSSYRARLKASGSSERDRDEIEQMMKEILK